MLLKIVVVVGWLIPFIVGIIAVNSWHKSKGLDSRERTGRIVQIFVNTVAIIGVMFLCVGLGISLSKLVIMSWEILIS